MVVANSSGTPPGCEIFWGRLPVAALEDSLTDRLLSDHPSGVRWGARRITSRDEEAGHRITRARFEQARSDRKQTSEKETDGDAQKTGGCAGSGTPPGCEINAGARTERELPAF
jgi:hypothetical protein